MHTNETYEYDVIMFKFPCWLMTSPIHQVIGQHLFIIKQQQCSPNLQDISFDKYTLNQPVVVQKICFFDKSIKIPFLAE